MRSTFVTGFVRIGTAMRQATIRYQPPAKGGYRKPGDGEYVATTLAGATFDPWSAEWRTLRRVRNAAAAAYHRDHRLSVTGPSMFAFSTTALTKRDGTLAAGPGMDFDAFVEHMLVVGGDSTWHGETHEDRVTEAAAMLTQEAWMA